MSTDVYYQTCQHSPPSGFWKQGGGSRGCWGHIWTLFLILYKSCRLILVTTRDTCYVWYVTMETVLKHTLTVRTFKTKFKSVSTSWAQWTGGVLAADVEAGARCEWEEDDWRSLWRYRGLATAIMMPPAARTSTGNTVMQTHLATDTSSSLPILQARGDLQQEMRNFRY